MLGCCEHCALGNDESNNNNNSNINIISDVFIGLMPSVVIALLATFVCFGVSTEHLL